jgi:hypothetical protein
MGGYGSGGWYRYNKQTTTDDVRSVDIRLLRKWGCLPGSPHNNEVRFGTLSWSRGDEPNGTVSYEVTYQSLVLSFRYQRGIEPEQGIHETVCFDRTGCNFGGQRLWFICPQCGRRVGVVYLAGPRFLCRHCYKLPYSSQHESYIDRTYRKARRIRKRLGASSDLFSPVWDKPKGMHWNTFDGCEIKSGWLTASGLFPGCVKLNSPYRQENSSGTLPLSR